MDKEARAQMNTLYLNPLSFNRVSMPYMRFKVLWKGIP